LSIEPTPGQHVREQYARGDAEPARAGRRQIVLLGGILALVLVPAFVSLGLWQWRKAETKAAVQAELDTRSSSGLIAMPASPADIDSLRHRRVVLRGTYDASRQVLIDNRLTVSRLATT
jgi:surfeit locus 1 family protein